MNPQNLTGDVHAIGNGRLVVYGIGADIIHVYGAPYSSPNMLTSHWVFADETSPIYTSKRINGSNIWQHDFIQNDQVLVQSEELAVPSSSTYLTKLQATTGLRLEVELQEGFTYTSPATDSYLICAPKTAGIFGYPSGVSSALLLSFWGNVASTEKKSDKLIITFAAGESYLRIIGGESLPETNLQMAAAEDKVYAEIRAQVLIEGNKLTSRLLIPEGVVGADLSLSARIRELAENVAFLITAQQSEDGGLMAGHHYALAYVRDQYGACRGLLALGLYEEAKRNLEFRFLKWRHFGNLQNAESMGHHRTRHIHENDDVEQTAYTILQAFDYAEATDDWLFIERIFPMLEWCWEAQLPHLHKGMLPFNGDETYVAGGFLPRSALNDGSMEATLMFLDAGYKLIPYARRKDLWKSAIADRYNTLHQEVALQFRSNFKRNGSFITNAPERAQTADLPSFRHGVCEGGCGHFGWTQRNNNHWYLCPVCAENNVSEKVIPATIQVNSVRLLPAFIHSVVLNQAEKTEGILAALELFNSKGYLPTNSESERFVGYDIGLLLYGLTELDHPNAIDVLRHIVAIADTTQAWVEYYDGGIPQGCRCRPWESGMNISAILHYLGKSSI